MIGKDGYYVSIVGGTNIDIQGIPFNKLIPKDSNMGEVKISLGGVGRNIGENLVKLGVNTKLISVLGDDPYGIRILDDSKSKGLDMDDSLILEGEDTSIYLSILDESHDMALALSSMEIYNKMTVEFIKTKNHIIENSMICIIDTNIPIDVIEYILLNNRKTIFMLDTVSTSKAKKVKDFIGYFHTIKPNRLEAEVLTGMTIQDNKDLKKAAEYFFEKGVKRVFITLGAKGVYYNDGTTEGLLDNPKINIVNATGAGDAFVAALAYSYLSDMKIDDAVRFAQAASIVALSHEDTINPNMSIENINLKMKEIGYVR